VDDDDRGVGANTTSRVPHRFIFGGVRKATVLFRVGVWEPAETYNNLVAFPVAHKGPALFSPSAGCVFFCIPSSAKAHEHGMEWKH
jgi:hypothetical protein